MNTGRFDPGIVSTGISFYEVLKVVDRVPLFAEDHIERLKRSVASKGVPGLPAEKDILENIKLTVKANSGVNEGNIRVLLHFEEDLNPGPVIYSYFIPHHYPLERDYKEGVHLVTVNAERIDVHCKIINISFREHVAAKITESNAWEALLVNGKGYVTEGSKSNFFGISGDTVVTPPGEDVLPGITRKRILEICSRQNIRVQEKKINIDDLGNFDSCFITGTSPGMLAAASIDNRFYPAGHPLLRELSVRYNKVVDDYIARNRTLYQVSGD